MRRAERRREIIAYLDKFYSEFMLYRDKPILNKMHCQIWSADMYEQLTESQKISLYLKLNRKNLD